MRQLSTTVAAALAASALTLAATASAATRFSSDPFVRMIERKLSGSAHLEIGPGTTVTLVECSCTVRYDGTSVHGSHYEIHLDKLD